MKIKEESEKVGLKLNIRQQRSWHLVHHFMANREIMETVTDSIFGGFKITADGECSRTIKRCLLLQRKAMTNLDTILKSRDSNLYCQWPI